VSVRDPVESGYESRIRLASEVATWGIAGIGVASAALPTTTPPRASGAHQLGPAGRVRVFWFHILPEPVFGRLRFTVGTAITQVIGAILLVLTAAATRITSSSSSSRAGDDVAMRVTNTLVVGAIGFIALVTILADDGLLSMRSAATFQLGFVRLTRSWPLWR